MMTVEKRIEVIPSVRRGEVAVFDKVEDRQLFTISTESLLDADIDLNTISELELREYVLDAYDEELHDLIEAPEE